MAAPFKSVSLWILAIACLASAQSNKPQVTIAAAANLSDVARELGARFESEAGVHPVFSFGSTAQLTQQIENGAPFDVVLAADVAHVEELERKGKLVSGSRAAYADGVLALWMPKADTAVNRIEDLASPSVHVIAVAKPELAPYGAASIEALRKAGLLEKVTAKIVYADNISMAKQYGASGNADAVFTAYSLVMKEGGKVIRIDDSLHRPITQDLAVVASSAHKSEAMKFTNFILHGQGRMILKNFGYLPAEKDHQ